MKNKRNVTFESKTWQFQSARLGEPPQNGNKLHSCLELIRKCYQRNVQQLVLHPTTPAALVSFADHLVFHGPLRSNSLSLAEPINAVNGLELCGRVRYLTSAVKIAWD
ncbi:hypothetical protein CDAR_126441 [Caerostris darwini]|uniref:Uncharacterized protein n=1 Tax=Caerostris darwini TaxID=1538125 RepID=A0AAV4R1C1_9ARAC|nr:hypothetical protein CDAR_126441 [Caerostris darwini]